MESPAPILGAVVPILGAALKVFLQAHRPPFPDQTKSRVLGSKRGSPARGQQESIMLDTA
jgi:hypothetical protein